MSAQDQLTATTGVSIISTDTAATSVADVTRPGETRSGLRVGVTVSLVFVTTILAAVADTAVHGSITALTGIAFVIVCVLSAALVSYQDLSTAIIAGPLAYLTAVFVAGQPTVWSGSTDNLPLREVAMVIGGLAFSAPWIFAGTGAAALIVMIRRYVLHR